MDRLVDTEDSEGPGTELVVRKAEPIAAEVVIDSASPVSCTCPRWWYPGLKKDDPATFHLHHPQCVVHSRAVAKVPPSSDLPVAPSDTTLFFSRYQEDGSLRLYKENSYIGDAPAGYSDERVTVKILVKRPTEEFMVVIGITRKELDLPGAEERLANIAYGWKRR